MSANAKATKTKTALKQETGTLSDLRQNLPGVVVELGESAPVTCMGLGATVRGVCGSVLCVW
jgi:hypothetical protein